MGIGFRTGGGVVKSQHGKEENVGLLPPCILFGPRKTSEILENDRIIKKYREEEDKIRVRSPCKHAQIYDKSVL